MLGGGGDVRRFHYQEKKGYPYNEEIDGRGFLFCRETKGKFSRQRRKALNGANSKRNLPTGLKLFL
jgi:hypothetical protein